MTEQINVEKDVNIHLEDRQKSRSFFWFIWVLYAVVYMTKNCYNSAMAGIVAEGLLTKSQTGLISAMFYLVYTPLQIVGGMVSDRFSPERMIKIGLLGGALANLVIFLNQNYYVMMGAWMFNAVAQFGIWPSVFKIISAQLVRSERKNMIYLISFSSYGGLLLSYLLAAVVHSWQYNFAMSALSLVLLALVLHLYEKYLQPYWKWDAPEKLVGKAETADEALRKIPTLKILKASGFFFVLTGVILAVVVSQSRSTLTPIMLVENYDSVSPSAGNLLHIFTIVAGMAGTLIAGKFLSNIKNEVTAICVLHAAMVPFLLLCGFAGEFPIPAIIVFLCIVACMESVIGTLRNYYNAQFVKYGKSGTAAGICNAGVSLSFMIAAYGMPKVVEEFGWNALLGLWPVLIVLSLGVYIPVIRRFGKFKNQGI